MSLNPPVPAVLAELAGLGVRLSTPDTPAGERMSEMGLSAAILGIAAETWDRAAAILVEENRAIRALLGEEGEDADLRLTALGGENARLRGRLIALHVKAEEAGDAALCERIWAELVTGTERRKLSTAPL